MSKLAKLAAVFGLVLAMGLSTMPAMAEDADMSGTWDMEVVSPTQTGNPTFTLTQNGKKIKGTYKGAFGESPVKGKIKGNKFRLNFESSGVYMTYKGTVDGNKCEGTAIFGEYGTGTFSGVRK